MRFADGLRGAATALERWLLPAECLLCREAVQGTDADALVCALCRARWRRIPPPWCGRCGQPGLEGLACRLCAEWPAALGRVRSAVWLEGGAREVVHALKYDGWWRAAGPMAAAMRGLEPLTGRLLLVPVPLGRARLRARGYNQAERLAVALGGQTGAEVATVLRRARETRTQTALTPESRRANVHGAFAAGGVAAGAHCVLVDDVFTTGATLAACAEALTAAGAAQVEAVTFARAPLPVALDHN